MYPTGCPRRRHDQCCGHAPPRWHSPDLGLCIFPKGICFRWWIITIYPKKNPIPIIFRSHSHEIPMFVAYWRIIVISPFRFHSGASTLDVLHGIPTALSISSNVDSNIDTREIRCNARPAVVEGWLFLKLTIPTYMAWWWWWWGGGTCEFPFKLH